MNHPFHTGLDKTAANYQALTPLSFLRRAARVYPDRIAWVHGNKRATYREDRKSVV